MEPEDVIQLDTVFGKGLIGFILEKFLEKKFGVKFIDFKVPEFKIFTRCSTTKYDFNIKITGSIDKGEILRLVQKGDKEC